MRTAQMKSKHTCEKTLKRERPCRLFYFILKYAIILSGYDVSYLGLIRSTKRVYLYTIDSFTLSFLFMHYIST